MKRTAIDWTPYIPDNWKEIRIKDIARLQSGNSLTSDNIDEMGDYPVYGGNGLRGYTDSYTNDGSYVLIGRQGALCGNINYAEGKFYATEHAIVVYPNRKNENYKWVGETLRCADYNRLSASAAQPGLAVNVLNNQLIPYPPLEIRNRIADYLDAKTTEIDNKIELLGKKRDAYNRLKTATINRAVTRGLDEHVKLKDSGIERFGLIPEHWDVKRFKAYARTIKGKQCAQFEEKGDDMELILSVETLRQQNSSFPIFGIIPEKMLMCEEGDIVIIWDGAGVGELLRTPKGILSSTIAKIDVNERIVAKEYFWHWRYGIEYILKQMPTGMGIPHLNPTILNNLMFAIPPLEEQKQIAAYLDERCAKIDAAVTIIGKQIDALKRLKRSLINEVVTGKRMV